MSASWEEIAETRMREINRLRSVVRESDSIINRKNNMLYQIIWHTCNQSDLNFDDWNEAEDWLIQNCGFTNEELAEIRKERKIVIDEKILETKLEKAAEYIVETSARETTTGSWTTHSGDIPSDILTQDLFDKHINDIFGLVINYGAVSYAEIGNDGCIDTVMFLAYCPNYEASPGEEDEYPEDRVILNPLETKNENVTVCSQTM